MCSRVLWILKIFNSKLPFEISKAIHSGVRIRKLIHSFLKWSDSDSGPIWGLGYNLWKKPGQWVAEQSHPSKTRSLPMTSESMNTEWARHRHHHHQICRCHQRPNGVCPLCGWHNPIGRFVAFHSRHHYDSLLTNFCIYSHVLPTPHNTNPLTENPHGLQRLPNCPIGSLHPTPLPCPLPRAVEWS